MRQFREVLRTWLRDGNSQAELSRQTGVPQTVISRWMSDDRPTRPTPANLQKLSPALGVPYEDLLRMCDYLPGEAHVQVDSRRAVVRDQLDRWLTAVGPDYEQDFWDYLKAHGESGVSIIRRLRTAISDAASPAVSDAISEHPENGIERRGRRKGPLSTAQHPTRPPARMPTGAANACLAA